MSNWIDIEGYKGYYKISDEGQIKSCLRNIYRSHGINQTIQERILKQRNHSSGYSMVSLVKDSVYEHVLVHRLVTKHFIGECPIDKEVSHQDGNKKNNNISNLSYATHSENMAMNIVHGVMPKGEKNYNAKLTESQVISIKQDVRTQSKIANEYGVSRGLIAQIKLNKIWRHLSV